MPSVMIFGPVKQMFSLVIRVKSEESTEIGKLPPSVSVITKGMLKVVLIGVSLFEIADISGRVMFKYAYEEKVDPENAVSIV